MRIRKLFHLSSLSDPQLLNGSSMAPPHHHLLQKPFLHQDLNPSRTSDSQIQATGSFCSETNRKKLEGEEEDEEIENKKKSNDSFRQGIIRSSAADAGSTTTTGNSLPQPANSTTNQFTGKWSDADKNYPPKKRRVNFQMTTSSDEEQGDQTKANYNMSSKTNKKCQSNAKIVVGGGDEQELIINTNKKPKRGNVIMEGSRCSRVNGRGWRCCQPTLVGYLLCEHHLGKGRLRSMQKRGADAKPIVRERRLGEIMLEKEGEDNHMQGEGKRKTLQVVVTTKKKKSVRIGVVKARSLSSLLAQEDTAAALAVEHGSGGE